MQDIKIPSRVELKSITIPGSGLCTTEFKLAWGGTQINQTSVVDLPEKLRAELESLAWKAIKGQLLKEAP